MTKRKKGKHLKLPPICVPRLLIKWHEKTAQQGGREREIDLFDIANIRKLCGTDAEIITAHCQIRMEKRGIAIADAECAIMNGDIIEEYPDDYPFPSCLIFGATVCSERLHVACSVGNDTLYLITAYKPNLVKFESDYKTRRKESST